MPTAAKLFAAIAFFVTGLLAAQAYKPQLPDSTQWGYFSVLVATIGACCGWFITGRRAGRGWMTALGIGLTTAVALVVWAVFLFSVREMVIRSMQRRYPDPWEAVVGTFDIILHFGVLVAEPRVLGILLAGGLLGGLIAEVAALRWN